MEILVIVLLIIMLVGVIAFASKEEAKAKPPESKLPDVPKPPETPKEPAPVEVKPVPPPAPTPTPVGDQRYYTRVVKSGKVLSSGLHSLIIELRQGDRLVDSIPAVSGQADAQNFVTDAARGFGTGEPLGERYYTLGKPEWAQGKVGDWSVSHGKGLGPVWVSLFPDDHVYGVHMDAELNGTLGCLGIQEKKHMETWLSWFRDPRTAPTLMVVNWGLKSVETKGMGYKSYGAPFDPHPKSAWEKLVEATKAYKAEFPKLKAIALAQWIIESGRGTSKLALEANNFGGMKYREELVAKVPGVSKYFYDEGRGEDDKNYFKCETPAQYVALYWAFMERSPYVGWREAAKKGPEDYLKFIANAGYMGGPNAPQAQKDAYVAKILSVYPEALSLLGEKAEPTSPTPTPTTPQTTAKDLLGLKVAIDVGHGLYAEEGGGMEYGAEGNGRREWDLNKLQGEELKKLLEARGAIVDVYCYHTGGTNERLTLSQKGMKGKNHHIFISCHHNAANNHTNYSCTMLSSSANRHKPDDRKLAAAISDRLEAIMGFGLGGDEDGIIESPLGVFSRRLTDWSDCRACCLVESYFIDSDKLAGQDFSALSRKAAGAIASGIANYAKSIGLV